MADFTAQEFQSQVESMVRAGYSRDRAVQLVYGKTTSERSTPAGKAKDNAISHGKESLRSNTSYRL